MTEHHHTAEAAKTSEPATMQASDANGVAVSFETNEFEDGSWQGFKYTVPRHNITGRKITIEVDEGVKAAVERYGEAILLSMFDAQVLARIRTKVKNGLPKNLKPAEEAAKQQELLQKHPDAVLFSEEEAIAWRPDIRELSPNQLFKKAKEAFNEAGKESDPIKKMEFMAKGQQYLVEMGKALQS